MIRIPLAPLRLTDYTRLTSPLSPHKRKSGSSSGSGTTASSRTSSSTSSSVATPSGDASSEARASTSASASTSTSEIRLSSTMASSLLPSPFGTTTTTTTPPVLRRSGEAGRPHLKTLYEASRPASSSSARAMAHDDEQIDDDDDDAPDEPGAQTTRAATTPPRRLMDLFLSSAAKEREASVSASRGHSPRSPQERSRTRSEPVLFSPARNAASASATPAPAPAPTSKDEEMAAAPTWSFYEDPVEPTPVASTTSNGANDSTLDAEGDEVEYHDENMKPSPTSLVRLLRHRSLAPVEAPRLMPSPTSMTFAPAPVPQTQVALPSTPPPSTLEWNEMHTITAIAIPGSPPSIFPTWDPIEDATKRQSFFGDTGNHSFDSRISSSHGFDEIGRKRSGLGEEELLEEAHEGKRMRLSSE